MLTPQTVLGFVKAEPFRSFRIHLASGRTFDVRHPEDGIKEEKGEPHE